MNRKLIGGADDRKRRKRLKHHFAIEMLTGVRLNKRDIEKSVRHKSDVPSGNHYRKLPKWFKYKYIM